jgi:hypothetical protein
MRDWRSVSLGVIASLSLSACGGSGGGGGSNTSTHSTPDTTAPIIHLTSLRLSGNVDTSAVVVAAPRSDEDVSPSAYQFTASLGSGGEPSDPLASGSAAVVTFAVVATTAAGSDERDITVTIDP